MNEKFRSIANDAGFVLWNDEDWKPENGIVDWSNEYDHELNQYSELLVKKCSDVIQSFVDERIPASEYPRLLQNHFSVK
jgi:hypothetical protein